MKQLIKLLMLIFMLSMPSLSYSADQVTQFYVLRTNSTNIRINGEKAEDIRNKRITFSLTDIIQWTNDSEWIEVVPLQNLLYSDYKGEQHKWPKGERRKICCMNASSAIHGQDFFWWIKRNRTSTKSIDDGHLTRCRTYDAFMFRDTVMIRDFVHPIDSAHQYQLVWLDKNYNTKSTQAHQDENSTSFFFTCQQLEEAGAFQDVVSMELRYNATVVVDYFTITKVR